MSHQTESTLAFPFLMALEGEANDAIALLYKTYHRSVASVLFRLGVREELDDLIQEVFLRAWKKRDSFQGKSTAKTWILSIAVNLAKDHLKKRRLPVAELDEDYVDPALERDKDKAEAIEACLQLLSVEAREMIVLALVEEYSMAEVAEILHIPVGTVKSRLFTAKRDMRRHLEQRGYLKP